MKKQRYELIQELEKAYQEDMLVNYTLCTTDYSEKTQINILLNNSIKHETLIELKQYIQKNYQPTTIDVFFAENRILVRYE